MSEASFEYEDKRQGAATEIRKALVHIADDFHLEDNDDRDHLKLHLTAALELLRLVDSSDAIKARQLAFKASKEVQRLISHSISHNEIAHAAHSRALVVEFLAHVGTEGSVDTERCFEVWGTTDGLEWRVHLDRER